jgi:anti-anti-sigma factor
MYTIVKDFDEVRVVTVLVEVIQSSNYEDVFAKVKAAVSDFNNLIVLDLSRVKFMDSISLGMLAPLLLYARRLGGDMVITAKDERICELFRVLQLGKVLSICGSVEEAIQKFRREVPTDGGD